MHSYPSLNFIIELIYDKSFVSLDVMRKLSDLNINLNWLVAGKESMFNSDNNAKDEITFEIEDVLKKKRIDIKKEPHSRLFLLFGVNHHNQMQLLYVLLDLLEKFFFRLDLQGMQLHHLYFEVG